MKSPFFFLAILLTALILTAHFFIKEEFPPGHISYFAAEKARHLAVKGIIISDPADQDIYFSRTQTFVVTPVLIRPYKDWLTTFGNIRVTSYNDKEIKYGDVILFEAALRRPYYRSYFERSGIYALATISDKDALIIAERGRGFWLKRIAYNVKDILKRNIGHLFRPPERYFISAVLLGERRDVPRHWHDIFIRTQTMHLLAISGLHVGIIAFILLFVTGLFGFHRNFKYTATILLLIFYAVMVGGRPSIARATVMAVLFLGSYLMKKDADIYNSVGLAAVAILIYNPKQLFDYGFILSFVSVLSIVYMTPLFNRLFRFDRIKRAATRGRLTYYFGSLFSASCAVWLGLLPLSVNFFNMISPVSVLVNILAIPGLFIIIALSLFSLMIQPLSFFISAIFAESAKFFIDILMMFLEFFSRIPFSCFEISRQNILAVIFYYMFLAGIIEYSKKH